MTVRGLANANGAKSCLAKGRCPADNAKGSRNRAKLGTGCITEEWNSLFILPVLLGVPVDVGRGDMERWMQGDIGSQRFSVVKEFKICSYKQNWQLGGEGKH